MQAASEIAEHLSVVTLFSYQPALPTLLFLPVLIYPQLGWQSVCHVCPFMPYSASPNLAQVLRCTGLNLELGNLRTYAFLRGASNHVSSP